MITYSFDNDNGVIFVYGEWPKTKKAAIRESVRKWKEIVANLENSSFLVPHSGPSSCALCQLYWLPDEEGSCIGCPVAEKTGRIFCVKTPHTRYVNASESGNYKKALRAAKDEVVFLESLL